MSSSVAKDQSNSISRHILDLYLGLSQSSMNADSLQPFMALVKDLDSKGLVGWADELGPQRLPLAIQMALGRETCRTISSYAAVSAWVAHRTASFINTWRDAAGQPMISYIWDNGSLKAPVPIMFNLIAQSPPENIAAMDEPGARFGETLFRSDMSKSTAGIDILKRHGIIPDTQSRRSFLAFVAPSQSSIQWLMETSASPSVQEEIIYPHPTENVHGTPLWYVAVNNDLFLPPTTNQALNATILSWRAFTRRTGSAKGHLQRLMRALPDGLDTLSPLTGAPIYWNAVLANDNLLSVMFSRYRRSSSTDTAGIDLVHHKDYAGHGLWFHLLGKIPPDKIPSDLLQICQPGLDTKDGCGLFAQWFMAANIGAIARLAKPDYLAALGSDPGHFMDMPPEIAKGISALWSRLAASMAGNANDKINTLSQFYLRLVYASTSTTADHPFSHPLSTLAPLILEHPVWRILAPSMATVVLRNKLLDSQAAASDIQAMAMLYAMEWTADACSAIDLDSLEKHDHSRANQRWLDWRQVLISRVKALRMKDHLQDRALPPTSPVRARRNRA